jgi:hypothetical protein
MIFETMRHALNRSPREDGVLQFSATSASHRQDHDGPDPKLKKRETDRLAQRACRQRQKNRIAYLEALVQKLRDGRESDIETPRSSNDSTDGRAGRKRSEISHDSVRTLFESLTQHDRIDTAATAFKTKSPRAD